MQRYQGNQFLTSLPRDEVEIVNRLLQHRVLRRGHHLFEVGDDLSTVFFPTSGVISSVTVMDDGGSIEAFLTGPEGLVGAEALWQDATTPWRIIAQTTVETAFVPTSQLRMELGRMPFLQQAARQYMSASKYLATQSIACNRFHPLHERTARWLLMVRDRVEDSELDLTQEFLANMLGVHRPSVSLALATLERAGLIGTARGRVLVHDRALLEQASCECYRRVEVEFERIFAHSNEV